jgi:hypothetical protein
MADDSSRQITAGRKPGRAARRLLFLLVGIFAVILLVGQEPGETTTPMMQAAPITDLSGTWTIEGGTFVTKLPADLPRGSLLQLSSIEGAYTVSVDGEEIYRVEPDNAATAFQWIPIPEDSAGGTLQIQGEAAEETLEALNASSLLGTQAALQRRLMASNFYALLFFLFCVFVAAFLLYASIQQRRRQVDPSLSTGSLGLFLLSAGIWALTDSQILQLVTARVNLGAMVSVICFFLMPVFFLQFLVTVLPNVRVIRCLELLFLGNMALGLFLHLVGVVSVYGYMLSNHLFLLVMMLLVLRHLSKDREPSHRKIRTGCFAYFVCEIVGLSAYYLAPTSRWYARILSLGVLVLSLFCLAAWFNRYKEDLNRIAQNELFKNCAKDSRGFNHGRNWRSAVSPARGKKILKNFAFSPKI